MYRENFHLYSIPSNVSIIQIKTGKETTIKPNMKSLMAIYKQNSMVRFNINHAWKQVLQNKVPKLLLKSAL